MLTVCTWLWGTKYDDFYVDRLFASLRRNLKQQTRLALVTERARQIILPEGVDRFDIDDEDLCSVKGCFARLRMFDQGWQTKYSIEGRLVCIDLDSIITGPLDTLYDRPGDFHILQGCNSSNPCPFNGSMMMMRAGTNQEIWSGFSLSAAAVLPYDSFPDDQGWLAAKIPNASAWTHVDGVYAFQKRGWPKGTALPANARVVAFPGWRDPSKFATLPWIMSNWRV